MKRLLAAAGLVLAILAACWLAAGCGSGSDRNAVSSAAASNSISVSPPAFTPGTRTPRPSAAAPPAAAQPSEPAVSSPAEVPAPAPAQSSLSPAVPQSRAATGSGPSLPWLWILLGAIAVVAVAALIARHVSRRSAAARWRSKMIDAYARGSALYDAMITAEAPGALGAEDDGMRRAGIQRRADDLSQELYALRETAPGEEERARVADVLATLQAVRSAMDAERATGGAGLPRETRVHDLLGSFDASLRALRAPGEYGTPV